MAEANLIDGKAFASRVREKISQEVESIKIKHSFMPCLAVILIGEDPASKIYVRNKGNQTKECGMQSIEHRLSDKSSEREVLSLIEKLNADPTIHGILVQLPLPKQIDESKVLAAINPEKDVDGFHVINVGRLWTSQEALVPCTPLGCLWLLKETLGQLLGKEALILGRSNIVGKPMAALLLSESCTVTIAHSKTNNLADQCRKADILIAAVGKAEMVSGDWIKPGATVIDVGINRINAPEKGPGKTKIVGDVNFSDAINIAGAITPVPGGVGPMTIACLLRNTVVAACRQYGVEAPKF